jgi:hypothetical protein
MRRAGVFADKPDEALTTSSSMDATALLSPTIDPNIGRTNRPEVFGAGRVQGAKKTRLKERGSRAFAVVHGRSRVRRRPGFCSHSEQKSGQRHRHARSWPLGRHRPGSFPHSGKKSGQCQRDASILPPLVAAVHERHALASRPDPTRRARRRDASILPPLVVGFRLTRWSRS